MHTARVLILLLAAASLTGCPERPGTKKDDSSRAGAKKDGKKAPKAAPSPAKSVKKEK